MNAISLDRTDLRLLAEIQQHGRATNAELATRVNLSPSACLRRVQRLEADGVIAGYGARLEPRAIGLGLQAFVRVQLSKHGQAAIGHFVEAVQLWDEHAESAQLPPWRVVGVEVVDRETFHRRGRYIHEQPGLVAAGRVVPF